jgi:hypothetical protein
VAVEVLMPGIRVGGWVQVLESEEIGRTLDERGCLEGLPFMPEMQQFTGRVLQVQQRAERTCVHPPQSRFPHLPGCFTLVALRCDGSAHGGCQLGCMFFWKEAWLRPVEGPDTTGAETDTTGVETETARPDTAADPRKRSAERTEAGVRSARPPAGARGVYTCQGTELPRATIPGDPPWNPLPYLRLLRDGTYTPIELAGALGRMVSRRLVATMSRRGSTGRLHADRLHAGGGPLRLRPGDWVKVRSANDIRRTLDPTGKLDGLAFGGDMDRDCGRVFRVRDRVERIIDERSGRLRAVANTVVLDGSLCDRYLGCARGMPVLWREAWLQRAAPPDAARPCRDGT